MVSRLGAAHTDRVRGPNRTDQAKWSQVGRPPPPLLVVVILLAMTREPDSARLLLAISIPGGIRCARRLARRREQNNWPLINHNPRYHIGAAGRGSRRGGLRVATREGPHYSFWPSQQHSSSRRTTLALVVVIMCDFCFCLCLKRKIPI